MDLLTKEQINVEATFDNDFFTGKLQALKTYPSFRTSDKGRLCTKSTRADWPQ